MPNGPRSHSHHRLDVGDTVVIRTNGELEGVDPFTPLVVTGGHKDGTVDVETKPSSADERPRKFTRVKASSLRRI